MWYGSFQLTLLVLVRSERNLEDSFFNAKIDDDIICIKLTLGLSDVFFPEKYFMRTRNILFHHFHQNSWGCLLLISVKHELNDTTCPKFEKSQGMVVEESNGNSNHRLIELFHIYKFQRFVFLDFRNSRSDWLNFTTNYLINWNFLF